MRMKRLFNNFFENKNVLITGHTGFMGIIPPIYPKSISTLNCHPKKTLVRN